MTPSCIDISIFFAPVGTTGGLLNALFDNSDSLNSDEETSDPLNRNDYSKRLKVPVVTKYSINKSCFTGMILDNTFG